MPNIFSEELISRLKQYFKDRYGQELTTEQTVVFLSSFADLYIAVAGGGGRVKRTPAPTASSLLDIYHT